MHLRQFLSRIDDDRLKAKRCYRERCLGLDLVRKGLWEGSLRRALQGTEASNGAEGKDVLTKWQS